jgi:hypothetical protein
VENQSFAIQRRKSSKHKISEEIFGFSEVNGEDQNSLKPWLYVLSTCIVLTYRSELV